MNPDDLEKVLFPVQLPLWLALMGFLSLTGVLLYSL